MSGLRYSVKRRGQGWHGTVSMGVGGNARVCAIVERQPSKTSALLGAADLAQRLVDEIDESLLPYEAIEAVEVLGEAAEAAEAAAKANPYAQAAKYGAKYGKQGVKAISKAVRKRRAKKRAARAAREAEEAAEYDVDVDSLDDEADE